MNETRVNLPATLESAIRFSGADIPGTLHAFFAADRKGRQAMLKVARDQWAIVRAGRGFRKLATDWLTWPDGQHKLGMSKEVYNTGQTLQTATADGNYNACPWSGECVAVCVLKGGMGMYPRVQLARSAKNDMWSSYPALAAILWAADILKGDAKAAAIGRVHLHRPNVNSDIRWDRIMPAEFFDGTWFPNTVFNDYTKNPATLGGNGWVAPKYRKTYSVSENTDLARIAPFLGRGGTATVVTDRKKKEAVNPAAVSNFLGIWGILVVDGDIDDNRYNDPAGAIIDLTAKGRARTRGGSFVKKIYH